MTLPKQSALISLRNKKLKEQANAAEAARLAADPRRIELARLQKESEEERAKYDKLFQETGNKVYAQKSDNIRRRSFEKMRSIQRALDKGISVRDQEKRERSKAANQRQAFAAKNVNEVLTDKFGKDVVAAMSPEAKATAYEQLTNKDFVATPNTAKAKDNYNRRQEANTQAQKRIIAGGFTTAGEYFNSFSPEKAGVTVSAASFTPLRNTVTPRSSLSPTLEFAPNTSTESGAIYTAPNYQEPNTSTEAGAVYTAPSYSPTKLSFGQATKERLPAALKVAGSQIKKGFFFSEGLNADNKGTAETGLYRVGQGLNLIPAGAAVKGVQLAGKAYTTYKAGKFYNNLNLGGKTLSGVGAFAAGQTAVISGGTATARLYETQQLKTNLQGYNITPEDFRGVMSNAIVASKKEGKWNALKYQISTRFGDEPALYEESLNKQLSAKGFNDSEIKYLINVANNTRGTREIIEAGTLVASASVTELFGRGGFSAVNAYANKVFTRKVLRESSFKAGGKFVSTPLSSIPYAPALSSAQALGVTATTKGGVLAIGGFGEASSQEFLTQNVRQEARDYKAIFKQGAVGGFTAPALGVPIARSFEVGALGKGKGINMFANTVDVFEYAGDKLADGITTVSKLNYRVPTITVGGSAKSPTYAYGSANVQAETQNNYFLTRTKGQDTFNTKTSTKFNVGSRKPQTEAPRSFKDRVTTPTPSLFPQANKQDLAPFTKEPAPIPIPNDNKPITPIPSSSRNTVPTPIPAPASVPTPVPVPIPVPVPTTAPVPITVPVPVVTATPEAAGFAVGGGLGFGGSYERGKKRKLKYNPSAFSLITGYKGSKSSKSAVKTGFAIRPISNEPTKKNKGKKNNYEELLAFGKKTNGRKRKYKRFASF